MNLEEISIEELINLKCKVELELKFRKKLEKYKHSNLLLSGKELINYISAELGYNIIDKIRQPHYTFARYVVAEYLKTQALTIKEIAEVLNMNHSTVVHALNMANILTRLKDAQFMLIKIKIDNHIINFKTNNNGKEHININNNGKEHFNADSARTQSA
jgi:hypothetical protein